MPLLPSNINLGVTLNQRFVNHINIIMGEVQKAVFVALDVALF